MPRITRAALRSNTDSDSTDTGGHRRVFGEITGNSSAQPLQLEAPALVEIPLKAEDMPPKKAAGKGKAKAKGRKKPKKAVEALNTAPEVLEDDNQSDASDAADEACEKLRSEDHAKETYQIPMPDHDRPNTPPSRAVREATKQLSPKTPKFDPEVHVPSSEAKAQGPEKDDSFVENIGSRSPAKKVFIASDEQAKEEDREDSFVGRISSRSPNKATTRIEDSVAAIDALEDALEEIGQALPTVQETESPVKTKKSAPPVSSGSQEASKDLSRAAGGKSVQAKIKISRQNVAPCNPSATRKPSVAAATKAMAPRAVSGMGRKPTQNIAPADIANPTLPKTRTTSTFKPPFQTTKSTKLPTTSTFELPGEAISRKLKAQREERLKKEAEEAQKRKEFKAKPVRLSAIPTVTVKSTTASNARISLVQETAANSLLMPSRTSSIGPISKRLSQLALPKRTISPSANTTAVRSPSLVNTKRNSSIPAAGIGAKNVITKEEAIHQKLRAKEIFGRDKAQKEDREREKKDKEEAARKARAQAAERGRQASREWAEKQKARQVSAKAAVAA